MLLDSPCRYIFLLHFLHKETSSELVRPTDTGSDKLLIRKWEWVKTREKIKWDKRKKKKGEEVERRNKWESTEKEKKQKWRWKTEEKKIGVEESGYSDLQSVIVTVRLGLDIIFGLYKLITDDSILLLYLYHTWQGSHYHWNQSSVFSHINEYSAQFLLSSKLLIWILIGVNCWYEYWEFVWEKVSYCLDLRVSWLALLGCWHVIHSAWQIFIRSYKNLPLPSLDCNIWTWL